MLCLIDSTSSDNSALDEEEEDPTLMITPPPPPPPAEEQQQRQVEADEQEKHHEDQSQNMEEGSLVLPPVSGGATLVSAVTAGHQKRGAPGSARSQRRVVFSQPTGDAQRQEGPTDLNNPSFIFLQLYHSSAFNAAVTETPLLLPSSEVPASTEYVRQLSLHVISLYYMYMYIALYVTMLHACNLGSGQRREGAGSYSTL